MLYPFKEFLIDILKNPANGIVRVFDILLHGTKTSRIIKQWGENRDRILSWSNEESYKYASEIEYLKHHDDFTAFPYEYKTNKEQTRAQIQFDKRLQLSYAIHSNKRLYFPSGYSMKQLESTYPYYIDDEGITGQGKMIKTPHSYVKDGHRVDKGDVLLDIGCAEALFALDNADIARRIYLFEPEKLWQKPLQATFKPYADKTIIIPKLVSSQHSEKSIRLEDAVKLGTDEVCFVKMDIEGYEKEVLKDSKDFFTSHKVKLSCCLYHNQEDEEVIVGMLKEWGYITSLSEGYMIPMCGEIKPPYFRKGMVYARNY